MSTPRTGRKISQLPTLTSASLEVFVVGVSGETTYKLSLDALEDAVINTISSSLDNRVNFLEEFSSSYNQFSASVDTQLNTNSSSALEGRLDVLESFTASYATTGSNEFIGNQNIQGAVTASYFKGDGSGLTNVTGALNVDILDEGIYKGAVSTFNFVGSHISASIIGGLVQIQTTLPSGLISSSAQLSELGFTSSSADISELNSFTSSYYIDSASFDSRIIAATNEQDLSHLLTTSSFNDFTSSQEITNANVNDDINILYDTKLNTSSFNSFTQSYQTDSASFDDRITNLSVAGVPTGTISGSAQITSLGFVSGSYETTGRGIISSSADLVTTSSFNTLSSSVATVQTNLNTLTASLGVTSTPFNYTSVVNPSDYVLVSYPTASYNGGSMDIIVSRPSDSTAVSNFCLIASYGGTGTIASKASQNSGAGAPNPSFTLALSGSVMNIRVSVSSGTYNIKGVARLF